MRGSIAIILAAALLSGTAISAHPDAGHAPGAEQGPVAITQDAERIRSAAMETLRGVVDSVDQRNDTIGIRLPAGGTEQFKVQDGLIFNAVHFGEPIEVSVRSIHGVRTIIGISEQ